MTSWRRCGILAALGFGLLAGPALSARGEMGSFDRAGWIADLDAMREAMTRAYPNLEWAAARGMDLPAVEARARARLAVARDARAAQFALTRFVQVFADGHLSLDWPAPPLPATAAAMPAERPPLCERLDFAARPDDGAIAGRLPGYQALSPAGDDNPIGIVRAGAHKLGVLRIAQFMPGLADCEAAVQQSAVRANADCEGPCRNGIYSRAEILFVKRLEQRVQALAAQRPDLILVDLARNGGGSDSAITAARLLGGAGLAAPRVARMAGPALAADLAEDRATLRAGLASATPGDMTLLRRLDAGLADAERQAARTCDRGPLWRGERIPCTSLVEGSFFAGGLLAGGLRGRQEGPDWVETVDSTARHAVTPGLWSGPLLVLVDGDTASAAELFAAMLQDAGRATIVGAPSFGSGCGWMLPQQPVTLPHSGGRLLMPDCARYRRDGRNELDGIQPDVLIGLRAYDSARQRAERLLPRLAHAAARAVADHRPAGRR